MALGDRPAHPMEADQMIQMLQAIKGKSRKAARDRAIIVLLWRCGLRNSELRYATIDHIRLSGRNPHIRVMRPKGRKRGTPPRNIGLDKTSREVLGAWLKVRGEGQGKLFPSLTGMDIPITIGNLGRMIRDRARRAGLTRRVHPHCLRHTFAKDLCDEGVNMLMIQKLMGHTSLDTTAKYLSHIGMGEAAKMNARRSWEL